MRREFTNDDCHMFVKSDGLLMVVKMDLTHHDALSMQSMNQLRLHECRHAIVMPMRMSYFQRTDPPHGKTFP